MWGFIPLAGWTSIMKNSFHRTSAPEKSNPHLADERLPREVRAEGQRLHQELQAKHDNGSTRSPS